MNFLDPLMQDFAAMLVTHWRIGSSSNFDWQVPNLAEILPVDIWLDIKGSVSHWLTTPSLVILPLLVLTALSWTISPSWRNRLGKVLVSVLLIYALFSSPVGASLAIWGLTFPLPQDLGTTVDEIIVLNRGMQLRESRAKLATQLFQEGRSPRIWGTGDGEISTIRQQLQAKNLSIERVSGIQCPRTTYEEAIFTAAILGPQGVRRILLITDPPHMLRAYLTFKSFGWEVIPRLSALPTNLSSAHISLLSLQNYIGLFSYWVLGRFHHASTDILQQPDPETLRQLEAQKCRVR